MLESATRWCLDHPRAAFAVLTVLTLVLGAGLPSVRSEYGYTVLIGEDHPAVVDLERHVATFGGGAPIRVAWECGPGWPCAHPLDDASLRMADAVARSASGLNAVQRVYAPSNATLVVPDDAGFEIRRLVEQGRLSDDRPALVQRAVSDPLWRGRLISHDETTGVLYVQPRDTDVATAEVVLDALLASLGPWQEQGFEFALVGNNVSAILGGRALDESIARVIPALVVVVAIVLAVLTKSLRSSGVVLASMGVAVLWTLGLLGHLGWPQDGILEVLAPLVLVVGICDGVHFVHRAAAEERNGRNRREATIAAASRVGPACALTTATTSLAFLSFTTSPLDTFVRFGSIATAGVVLCLIATFTLLPLLLQLGGAAPWQGTHSPGDALVRATLGFARRRAVAIYAATALLTGVSALGAPRIVVDTDWEEMLGRDHPAIQWMAFVADRLGYAETVEIALSLPDSETIHRPESLAVLESLGRRIEAETALIDPTSVVRAIDRLHRALSDDDAIGRRRTADSTRGNAEVVEILAFDDPALLASWVSLDRTQLRLALGAPMPTHTEERRAVAETTAIVAEELPAGWRATITGEPVTTVAFVRDVTRTQVRSFPTAALLVVAALALALRSPPLAVAAIVPTIVPALAVVGSMGWLGMPLDMGRAMIAAVILGIGVDDAIHLLAAYRAHRPQFSSARDAIASALMDTGPALIATSLALALGFLTLRLAAWATIASFGTLVAAAILTALVTTLLLPAAGIELSSRLLTRRTSRGPDEADQDRTPSAVERLTKLMISDT